MQIFPALIQQQDQKGLFSQLDSSSKKGTADFAAWLESSAPGQKLQALAKESGSGQGLSLEQILQSLGQELDSKQLQKLLSFLQEDQDSRQSLLQALEGEQELSSELQKLKELLQEQLDKASNAQGQELDSKQLQKLLSFLQEDQDSRSSLLQALEGEQELSSELQKLKELLQKLDKEASGISEQDQELVQGLLQKLGLDKEQSQEALLALQEGHSERFWQLLEQGLQELPRDKGLELENREVFALAKSLGLAKEQGLELASRLAGSKDLDVQKMQQVLDSIRQEQAKQADKSLQQLLDKLQAWQTEQGQGQNTHKSQEEGSRMLQELEKIVRHVLQGQDQAQNQTSDKGQGTGGAAGKEGQWISGLEQQKVQDRAQSEQRIGSRTEQPAQSGQEQRLESGSRDFQQGREFSGFKDESNKDWSKFWERLQGGEKQDKSRTDWRLILQGQERSQALQQEARAEAETQKTDLLKDNRLRQEVMRQIQDGMLRNLGSGRQELSLRLHPPELGRVDVVLQLQGNQVNALLKTTSQEVGQLLQQQLSSLQQQLEQQGLKVQKLDVQTQLAQEGSGQQWMGEKKHNQAQEERQRQKQWSLRRRLDLLGMEQGQEEALAVAQGLSPGLQGQGLYLIA